MPLGMHLGLVMLGWILTDVPQHVAIGRRHFPINREDESRKMIASALPFSICFMSPGLDAQAPPN
jgi:hypothetical protein